MPILEKDLRELLKGNYWLVLNIAYRLKHHLVGQFTLPDNFQNLPLKEKNEVIFGKKGNNPSIFDKVIGEILNPRNHQFEPAEFEAFIDSIPVDVERACELLDQNAFTAKLIGMAFPDRLGIRLSADYDDKSKDEQTAEWRTKILEMGQALFDRGYKERELDKLIQQVNIVRVQATYKGWKAKTAYDADRELRAQEEALRVAEDPVNIKLKQIQTRAAARTLQAGFRGMVERKVQDRRFRRAAATTLQAVTRGYHARLDVMREVPLYGFLVEKLAPLIEAKPGRKEIKIRKLPDELKTVGKAALFLQKVAEGKAARRMVFQALGARSDAELDAKEREFNDAANKSKYVQELFRAFKEKREKGAAVKIQSVYRGFKARQKYNIKKLLAEQEKQKEEFIDELLAADDEETEADKKKWPRNLTRKEYEAEVKIDHAKDILPHQDKWIHGIKGFDPFNSPKSRLTGEFDHISLKKFGPAYVYYNDQMPGTAWDALHRDIERALEQDVKPGEIRTAFAKISATFYKQALVDGKPQMVPETINDVSCDIIQTEKGVSCVFRKDSDPWGELLAKKEADFQDPEKRKKIYAQAYDICANVFNGANEKDKKAEEVRRVARALVREQAHAEYTEKLRETMIQAEADSLSQSEYDNIIDFDNKEGVLSAAIERIKSVSAPIVDGSGLGISRSKQQKNTVKVNFKGNPPDFDIAYVYVEGTQQGYVAVRVATKDGPMAYRDKNGELKIVKDCKAGQIFVDECISHLDTKTGQYEPVPIYGFFGGYTDRFGKVFAGATEATAEFFNNTVIEATSQIGEQRGFAIKTMAKPGKELSIHSGLLPQALAFQVVDGKKVPITFEKTTDNLSWEPHEIFITHPNSNQLAIRIRPATYTGYHKLNNGEVKHFKEGEVITDPLPYTNDAARTEMTEANVRGLPNGNTLFDSIVRFKIAAKTVDKIKEAERELRDAARMGDEKTIKRILKIRDDVAAKIAAKIQRIDAQIAALPAAAARDVAQNAEAAKLEAEKERVKNLKNIDINAVDSTGRTALVLATEGHHGDVEEVLVVPLVAGVEKKITGAIGLLLEAGADASIGHSVRTNQGLFKRMKTAMADKASLELHRKKPAISYAHKEETAAQIAEAWPDKGEEIAAIMKPKAEAAREERIKATIERTTKSIEASRKKAEELRKLAGKSARQAFRDDRISAAYGDGTKQADLLREAAAKEDRKAKRLENRLARLKAEVARQEYRDESQKIIDEGKAAPRISSKRLEGLVTRLDLAVEGLGTHKPTKNIDRELAKIKKAEERDSTPIIQEALNKPDPNPKDPVGAPLGVAARLTKTQRYKRELAKQDEANDSGVENTPPTARRPMPGGIPVGGGGGAGRI